MASNSGIFSLALIVLILPLLAFVIQIILPRQGSQVGSIFSSAILAIMTFLSILIANDAWHTLHLLNIDWFKFGTFQMTAGVSLDRWAGIMLTIVSFISLLVNIFSIKYMKEDEGYKRYFAILSFFTFSMIGIIIADSLFVIFIFWELVGMCSYLLIGHWFEKKAAASASKKAFIVNRIGDVGFLVALALCWTYFNTFNLSEIQSQLTDVITASGNTLLLSDLIPDNVITVLGITFFIAAIGKSAQFPLLVWLPDAMEGPTPVSALIHAATMVAAGVYLLSRVFFLLNVDVLMVIALVGSITAFMGAIAAITQHDIKKVLAFSTISQLGYMVVGIGVGSYHAALFHLFTHAFFKAGLFLAAGAIIHYLHQANHGTSYNTQDMRLMGGLRKKLPITFITYSAFSMALIGLPLFSGFLSKEAILLAVLEATQIGGIYYLVALLTFISVAITAFYVFRQLLLIFFDNYRGEKESAIMESSTTMTVVLIVLAIFSLGFIWALNPFNIDSVWVLSEAVEIKSLFVKNNLPNISAGLISAISIILIMIGGVLAYIKYRPGSATINGYREVSTNDYSQLERISFNNWYLDAIYQKYIIQPLQKLTIIFSQIERYFVDRIVNVTGIAFVILSNIIAWLDRTFIDGVVNSSAYLVGRTGVLTKSIQGGKVQSYIIWAVIGVLIILFLAL